jgi:hypothetical protein
MDAVAAKDVKRAVLACQDGAAVLALAVKEIDDLVRSQGLEERIQVDQGRSHDRQCLEFGLQLDLRGARREWLDDPCR